MNTAVLAACAGGWRFRVDGQTVVDLLGEGDRVVGSVAVDQVRIGRRVSHMGQPHRLVEIVDAGTTRRLVKGPRG